MHALARTAATVVAALAAAAMAGCSASAGPQASASPSPRTAVTRGPASASPAADEGPVPSPVPRDYVTLDPAHSARLIVRDTVTGMVAATVTAPRGMVFTGVFGTGTGRVFVVDARPDPPTPGGGDALYLLRLQPTARPGRVAPLPLVSLRAARGVGPGLTAVALSPDASKIAIAYTYLTTPPAAQPLSLYSAATGALLRTWTVKGVIAASLTADDGTGQDSRGISLRWTADSRRLAFAFRAPAPGKGKDGYASAASIRLLDATAPAGDLLARSRLLRGPDPVYTPAGTGTQCLVASGWSVSADGQGVTCAAQWLATGQAAAGPRPQCPGQGAKAGGLNVGFWRQHSLPGGGGELDTVYGTCAVTAAASIQLFWASPDGRIVLGLLRQSGHAQFGLYSAGHDFIGLAPPPSDVSLASIAW